MRKAAACCCPAAAAAKSGKERASEAYTAAAGLLPLGSSRLVLVLHRTQLFLERPRQRLDIFLMVARPPAFGCLSRPTIGSKSAGERCARCSCSDASFW